MKWHVFPPPRIYIPLAYSMCPRGEYHRAHRDSWGREKDLARLVWMKVEATWTIEPK
jgi:hypothetical protein